MRRRKMAFPSSLCHHINGICHLQVTKNSPPKEPSPNLEPPWTFFKVLFHFSYRDYISPPAPRSYFFARGISSGNFSTFIQATSLCSITETIFSALSAPTVFSSLILGRHLLASLFMYDVS